MSLIDLHTHTIASDGILSPKELVDLAIQNKLKVIAITDHDTIAGVNGAVEYSKDKNIQIISGIEIGCDEFEKGYLDVHIVGLFVDYKNKELEKLVEKLNKAREIQKKLIIKKLNELGYEITFEELKKEAKGTFGRPHIARILIKKYPEKFSEIKEVFEELLERYGKAYVIREKPKIKEAIGIIKNAGGFAILAHPGVFNKKDLPELIEYFIKCGGEGIEADYPYDKIYMFAQDQSLAMDKYIRKIAKEKKLFISGGSDFHDKKRKTYLGEHGISEEEFNKINQDNPEPLTAP